MATVSIRNATGNIILLEATEIVTGTVTSYSIAHNMSAIVPGTASNNLGKAEDAAHASGDIGVAFLGVRRDTAASGAGTDGDYATINLDSTGKVWVTGVYLEDAAHTSADKGMAALAVRRDTRSVGSDTDGDYSIPGMNAQGDLYVQASQKRALFTAVPTTAAGTYAAGDVIGTLMTITSAARFSGGSGVIENIVINDKANVATNIDLVLFSANPSNSTFTDNAAYTVNVADWDKVMAAANIDNSFPAAGNRSLQYCPPAGIPFVAVGSADIYAVLVARTSIVLASATDIKLALTIRQD
jgi:hypothetical protein